MIDRLVAKERLIEVLAHFLVDDQAAKSILLQVESTRPASSPVPKIAQGWAKLYSASGLQGYCEYERAVEQLKDLLM